MGILSWLLFGLLVGWVASILTHSKRRGIIRNIIVGILGAVVGGFIAQFFGFGSVTTFTLEGFLISLGGAVLLTWLLRRL